jgi:hypothetical protein
MIIKIAIIANGNPGIPTMINADLSDFKPSLTNKATPSHKKPMDTILFIGRYLSFISSISHTNIHINSADHSIQNKCFIMIFILMDYIII